MIDVKALENDSDFKQQYVATLKGRGEDPSLIEQLLALNEIRKRHIFQLEENKAHQKRVGQEIAQKKRNKEDTTELLNSMQQLASELKDMQAAADQADQDVQQFLLRLPNKLHTSVPMGKSEVDNRQLRVVGEPTQFAFQPKEHGDLGEQLKILNFERAGNVTGARFSFLLGLGARLERALINFMLDLHTTQHGYQEMLPPFIVNSSSLMGTGQFPKFKEDVFGLSGTDYFLIPTAEVPVTNYYRGEILEEGMLPQKFAAYSPCFRSEAGSHGRDTKGLIRQHQFNKVELMVFAHPSQSYELHDALTLHAEKVLQQLELPYRTMQLCSGDIGFGAAKCYDLEVWLPGQNAYREISSCSNFEDFQARRAGIRFRPKAGGKLEYVHTLNGSGLAVGRTLLAILENYQQEDGSVRIPKALQAYMGGLSVIRA